MIRGCIYARYSSDLQSSTSIHDQVRKAKEGVARLGCAVPDELIITDSEISGAATDRPGFQRFLAMIQTPSRPRSMCCW